MSMCDPQDKGKGPYTEISTLLSEYGYPSSGRFTNCVACLDSREWECSQIFFDNQLTNF